MHDVIASALSVEDDEPAPTGRDGKAYPRPTLVVMVPGGEARRRSLTDEYRDRTRKVLRAVESLERLHRDPRFPGELPEIQRRGLPVVVNHAAAKLNDLRDVLASDRTGWSS